MTRRKAKHEPKPAPAARERAHQVPLIAWALLLTVAVFAVFGRTLGSGFITADDGVYVTQNPTVQAGLTGPGFAWAFGLHEGNWIPLTWLSLMLDATIGGAGPRPFHLTNVLLHLANTLLLFGALFRMTGRRERSGFVALLFAIHPLHVESVAWVAERKDVLSGLFWMLGLLAWTAYARRPSTRNYVLVALALAAGLMAKPMLVSLPLAFLLLDFWPLRRALPWTRLVVEKLPLLALSAASSVIAVIAQRAGGAVSTVEAIPIASRVANALVAYATYLVKTVWPTGLAFFYPHPGDTLPAWQVLASAALLVALTLFAWRTRHTRPYVAMGWAWYVITLVPVIGLVQVGLQARADRYTYLPLIGPFIAITWGAADVCTRKIVAWGASAAIACALAATAYVYGSCWRDSVTLYTHALAVTTSNGVAHTNLALALLESGDLDGAVTHGREALRIDPGNPEAPNHLATALAREGDMAGAIAVYRQALTVRPNDATLHSNFGTVLAEQGDLGGAAAQFTEALRIDPNSSDAHYNMGILLARQERYDAAIAELLIAQRLSPFDLEIRASLEQARALKGAGR